MGIRGLCWLYVIITYINCNVSFTELCKWGFIVERIKEEFHRKNIDKIIHKLYMCIIYIVNVIIIHIFVIEEFVEYLIFNHIFYKYMVYTYIDCKNMLNI